MHLSHAALGVLPVEMLEHVRREHIVEALVGEGKAASEVQALHPLEDAAAVLFVALARHHPELVEQPGKQRNPGQENVGG
jgi:hypothetical protein